MRIQLIFLACMAYLSNITLYAQAPDSIILEKITVEPNPYYAPMDDNGNFLDGKITISNLFPDRTNIKIYRINGVLVKEFREKDIPFFTVEWNLKNDKNKDIETGIYLIHVNIKGIGERVIKIYIVNGPRKESF